MVQEDERRSEERLRYFLLSMTDENPGVRWKAIEALARTRDRRAVGPIIAALEDGDWRVRQKAAWALGFLGDPAAYAPLQRALRDGSEGVRDMALEALDEIRRKMIEKD
jgi:HEAT repeat protein